MRPSLAWTLLPLAVACGTAEASRELLPSSLDTTVAALAAADGAARGALERPGPPADIDLDYPGLRRAYSPADMRLHPCASLMSDGSVVGRDCPAGVVLSGPRVVAPTHSDVRVRFEIESTGDVELVSDIVSDEERREHGRLDQLRVPAREARTISYGVHVFEAAPRVEARVAVRGRSQSDFSIRGLEIEVR